MGVNVLGVLAGNDMSTSLLKKWADGADELLAADAGADLLALIGVQPDLVIGDMDSAQNPATIAAWAATGRTTLVQDDDQERTDCDKLLSAAEARGFDAITLAAVEGDRIDHLLSTLYSAAQSPLAVRVALRTGIGWVLKADDYVEVSTKPGRLVSLLPLSETEGVSLQGVEWPLKDVRLAPLGKRSISNRATSDHVSARVLEGAALFVVELLEEEAPIW
ncbi:MAG: thiamine diphosphokinase [Armatimonadetes bacterium]|nr:thiamine diphosphokinase [Armatimonadota bacterium]